MKPVVTTILLLFTSLLAPGQEPTGRHFLQTHNKAALYYVHIDTTGGLLYEMGSYLDKGGTGFSIRTTDTLDRQPDGTYAGQHTRIITESHRLYLVWERRKKTKLLLYPVKSPGVMNNNLNNAYYLDQYVHMSNELNKAYPLSHHSFRNGFHTWKELPDKEMDHTQFRAFADQQLLRIKDSVSRAQDSYVALTEYIIQHIGTIDYTALKEHITKLSAEPMSSARYFTTVLNEVARQRPGDYFRLAEDFPDHRSPAFAAVEEDKETIRGLKAVEGHDELKKAFFKDRRFTKTIPYKIIGTYTVVAGLLILLLVK